MTPATGRPVDSTSLAVGFCIIVFGFVVLLNQMGMIHILGYGHFWPFVLIAVGLVKLANPPAHGRRTGGWWVFFGACRLLNETWIPRFDESWPLHLVAVGVSIVWNQLARPRPRLSEKAE